MKNYIFWFEQEIKRKRCFSIRDTESQRSDPKIQTISLVFSYFCRIWKQFSKKKNFFSNPLVARGLSVMLPWWMLSLWYFMEDLFLQAYSHCSHCNSKPLWYRVWWRKIHFHFEYASFKIWYALNKNLYYSN